MNYKQTLEFINSFLVFGSKPGLNRIDELLTMLDNPQQKLKIIHVAGTNGKGSVCSYINTVLTGAGYKTGMYISPYVNDFRERITINGEFISENELIALIEYIKPFLEKMTEQITEFELLTAAAFYYYHINNCDFVVLETGLGGRFDATNIIPVPLVSVITSISFDHMQYLGDTLEKIAFEKSGIIKENGITVYYPIQDEAAFRVISESALKLGNAIITPDLNELKIVNQTICENKIEYKKIKLDIPLIGEHQVYNCITAVEALKALSKYGYIINDNIISESIRKTFVPSRFEKISDNPVVIIDGAHNEDAIHQFSKSLECLLPNKKIIVIMGMLRDKEYLPSITHMAKNAAYFIAVTPLNERALPASDTKKIAENYCTAIAVNTYGKAVKSAIIKQREIADSIIAVCGSLFITGEIKDEFISNTI